MSKRVRGAPGDVESPGNLSSGGGHCIGLGAYININHQPKLPISKSHEGPEGGGGGTERRTLTTTLWSSQFKSCLSQCPTASSTPGPIGRPKKPVFTSLVVVS